MVLQKRMFLALIEVNGGVNLFQDLTKQLAVGVEVGNFKMKTLDADSNYAQLSLRYVL